MKSYLKRSSNTRQSTFWVLVGCLTTFAVLSSSSSQTLAASAASNAQKYKAVAKQTIVKARTPGVPQLISPAPGTQLPGSAATFTWATNGADVSSWYIRVGSSAGSGDIAEARFSNPSVTQMKVTGLPTDGQSIVNVEFSHRSNGDWIRVREQFIASKDTRAETEYQADNQVAAQADNQAGDQVVANQTAESPQPASPPVASPASPNIQGPVGGGSCPGVPSSFRNTTYVNSANQLKNAVSAARPGDAVIVRNGTYNWSSQVSASDIYKCGADRPLVLNGQGTGNAPVYILAESQHGVKFTRSGVDWVLAGRHMVIAGFHFTKHGPFFVVNSDNRIACNRFELNGSVDVKIESKDADRTEIDNNEFLNSSINSILVWRCNPMHPTCLKNTKGTHIHHNTFRNGATNTHGGAILLGLAYSPLDGVRTYNADGENLEAVVENNLFDNWNGAGWLITIKSSKNIIRNNCVINSPRSSFTIRAGNDNLVTGNWLENAGGGIRISGRRNTVVFNYNGRKTGNTYGFRLHTGESYPSSFRPGQGFDLLHAYIDASDNVLSHNVISGTWYLVDAHDPTGRVFQKFPTANVISGNDIYSDNYHGTNEVGGYNNNSGHYDERSFRRSNSWGQNSIKGYQLPASACGNPNLFDGPGGRSATHQGSSNLLGGAQVIRAPEWW